MAQPAINFFSEDTSFSLKQKKAVKIWILEAIRKEGYDLEELNIIFCSDEYLLKINQSFLNHNTYTDIITFDNSEGLNQKILGDIFISIDRVFDNALKFKTPKTKELNRVIIHGTLHLLGYKDKSPKDKALMIAKEDEYLELSVS